MKKFKHIIASALAFMLLVTLLVPSMSVSAATNYVFELGLDNIKDEVYEFMAYDIANNQLIELETQSKATWSPDWPGHFVVGHPDIYVIGKSERNGIVDMLPRTSDQLAPAIVFTALYTCKNRIKRDLLNLELNAELVANLLHNVNLDTYNLSAFKVFKGREIGRGSNYELAGFFNFGKGFALGTARGKGCYCKNKTKYQCK